MNFHPIRTRRLATLLALACGATSVQADTFLDANDCSPSIVISPNRLGVTYTVSNVQSVRSNHALQPGSGSSTSKGRASPATKASLLASGELVYAGRQLGIFYDPDAVEWYGFALDYTGTNPEVRLIVDRVGATPLVSPPIALVGITSAVHILVFGEFRAAGGQQTINAGADTVHHPFHHPAAYLVYLAGAPGAEFMGSGFGPEHAYAGRPSIARQDPVELVQEPATNAQLVLAPDHLGASYNAYQKSAIRANQSMIGEFPSVRARLAITAAPTEVALGDSISATARASFTPTTLGVHQLRAALTDSLGSSSTAVADVRVTRYRPHSAP